MCGRATLKEVVPTIEIDRATAGVAEGEHLVVQHGTIGATDAGFEFQSRAVIDEQVGATDTSQVSHVRKA